MTTDKHTELPWVLSSNINDTQDAPFKEWCVEGSDEDIVGFFAHAGNAEFIVKAVNNHDALVEMVGWLMNAAVDQGDAMESDGAIVEARALLARLKGNK